VYVRDFAPGRVPAVGSVKIRVSINGGDKPRWRRDGEELYYIAPDGRLMAASVNAAPVFDAEPKGPGGSAPSEERDISTSAHDVAIA
jgi:hypothetical protein